MAGGQAGAACTALPFWRSCYAPPAAGSVCSGKQCWTFPSFKLKLYVNSPVRAVLTLPCFGNVL